MNKKNILNINIKLVIIFYEVVEQSILLNDVTGNCLCKLQSFMVLNIDCRLILKTADNFHTVVKKLENQTELTLHPVSFCCDHHLPFSNSYS